MCNYLNFDDFVIKSGFHRLWLIYIEIKSIPVSVYIYKSKIMKKQFFNTFIPVALSLTSKQHGDSYPAEELIFY